MADAERTQVVGLRLTAEVIESLDKWAKEESRKRTNLIALILKLAIERREQERKTKAKKPK
jgi:hypothetical protein